MDDEYDFLVKNDVWELVPWPNDHNIVTSKWVFKVKGNGHFKVWLVARGFMQQYGIDYEETFAPVVKFASIQIILAIAAVEDLKIHQIDIKTAFLYSDINEKIYIE